MWFANIHPCGFCQQLTLRLRGDTVDGDKDYIVNDVDATKSSS